jgi:HSP20 family protein
MAQYSLFRPLASDPWGTFDQLRREMDAVFGRFAPPASAAGAAFPAVNLYEREDAFVLTAELPGVRPEDVEVTLEGSTVSIRGERRIEYPEANISVHRRERQSGSFRRAFELPVPIDADKVEAVQRNGVLMLRLPKSAEHQPRQISVRAS